MTNLTYQSNEIILSQFRGTSKVQLDIFQRILETLSPTFQQNIADTNHKGVEVGYKEDLFGRYAEITYLWSDLGNKYDRLRANIKLMQSNIVSIVLQDKSVLDTSVILESHYNFKESTVTLLISKRLFEVITTYIKAKGYTKLHTLTAMSFSSIYPMRVYELIAKWRNAKGFYVSLEELRFHTNTEDKFMQTGMFIKRVLEYSKHQLDESEITDLRFKYKPKKHGRTIVGFEITVIHTENSYEETNFTKVSPRWKIGALEIQNLSKVGIELKGKTQETIESYVVKFGNKRLANELERLVNLAISKGIANIPGYVINAFKKELSQANESASIGEEKEVWELPENERIARIMAERQKHDNESTFGQSLNMFVENLKK
jgi:plasmid replication initiation protein